MENIQYSERLSCYDGLCLVELDGTIDDLWLIVCVEAAWYCTSRGVDSIRWLDLKSRCDDALNLLTGGKRTNFGGNYQRILENPRYSKYLEERKYKRSGGSSRETYIYPNLEAIQKEVTNRRLDNINSGRKVLWSRTKDDKQLCERKLVEHVTVSEVAFAPRL